MEKNYEVEELDESKQSFKSTAADVFKAWYIFDQWYTNKKVLKQ